MCGDVCLAETENLESSSLTSDAFQTCNKTLNFNLSPLPSCKSKPSTVMFTPAAGILKSTSKTAGRLNTSTPVSSSAKMPAAKSQWFKKKSNGGDKEMVEDKSGNPVTPVMEVDKPDWSKTGARPKVTFYDYICK